MGGFLLWYLFYPHRPSDTSPKYDEIRCVCGFKIFIVGFGGGWEGVDDTTRAEYDVVT